MVQKSVLKCHMVRKKIEMVVVLWGEDQDEMEEEVVTEDLEDQGVEVIGEAPEVVHPEAEVDPQVSDQDHGIQIHMAHLWEVLQWEVVPQEEEVVHSALHVEACHQWVVAEEEVHLQVHPAEEEARHLVVHHVAGEAVEVVLPHLKCPNIWMKALDL
jgi:hypothetical protein